MTTEENLKQIKNALVFGIGAANGAPENPCLVALESLASLRETLTDITNGSLREAEYCCGEIKQEQSRQIAALEKERDELQLRLTAQFTRKAELLAAIDQRDAQIAALEAAAKESREETQALQAFIDDLDTLLDAPKASKSIQCVVMDEVKRLIAAAKERDARVATLEGALRAVLESADGFPETETWDVVQIARAALSPAEQVK